MTEAKMLLTAGFVVVGMAGLILLFTTSRFLRVLAFVTLVLGTFTLVAQGVPQTRSLPPVTEKFDVATIGEKKDLAAIGQKIFFGKGQCALCHTIGSSEGRCPDLKGVGAKLTREFIYESLTQPQAYVYKDYEHVGQPKFFPAKMPHINKDPIGLSKNEILAVIAFLQNMSGEPVTIELSEIEAPRDAAGVTGDKTAGQKVFQAACVKCHSIGAEKGKADLLLAAGKSGLRQAILSAPKPGNKDHQGFDRKLAVKDFDDLMAYLLDAKAVSKPL